MKNTPNAMPGVKPANVNFSSGPTTKFPQWSIERLKPAVLGRSHRSRVGKERLKQAIDLTREVLGVPCTHLIGIVPGSDTGAVEMALWSLLGARGVDILAWESFGEGWVTDIIKQLRPENCRILRAEYGFLPNLSEVNCDHDVVFTWNGTTSGVRVPDGEWIAQDRKGLTICDATSAAFAQELPFDKLDATTFSWQKVLGGEAGHGIIILSPRAVERLESHTPTWPIPKIFRLTKAGKLIRGIFEGETINTPSMLCVEDYIRALEWAKSQGGLKSLIARADANFDHLAKWVEVTDWIDFLADAHETRSNTSVCLQLVDPDVLGLTDKELASFVKQLVARLENEDVAYDINGHRDAPAGLRIWTGATVEESDVALLTPWLEWAFAETKAAVMKSVVRID